MVNNVDPLKIYFGDPYPINEQIVVYQPSIEDIMKYGELDFFTMLYIFIGNTTHYKLWLWENGIDWNKISDYELFCNTVRNFGVEKTKILFGEKINFNDFNIYKLNNVKPEDVDSEKELTKTEKLKMNLRKFERNYTLYNEKTGMEISANSYHLIADVLRETFKMKPKTEYTVGKMAKELLIEEERNKRKRQEMEEKKGLPSSTLLPLISFCVNHPGFKYKKNELRDVKINEFMDSVYRLQIYESTHALINGSYSGFADLSKIPKTQFDFMRPID